MSYRGKHRARDGGETVKWIRARLVLEQRYRDPHPRGHPDIHCGLGICSLGHGHWGRCVY